MVAFMNKIKEFISGENEEDLYDEVEEQDYDMSDEAEEVSERKFPFGKKSKVVNMAQPVKMTVFQATSFNQSDDICTMLKRKESIVLNLEHLNKEEARRLVDFMSGAVFALDGTITKVSNSIFLVAPFNYEVNSEVAREELRSKLSVSWLKNSAN